MENTALLEKVITEPMNETLRNELLRYFLNGNARRMKGIPMLKNIQNTTNHDEIVERMKAVTGICMWLNSS
jgi:hypothetical protein